MVTVVVLRHDLAGGRYGDQERVVDGYSPARIDLPGCMVAPGATADLIAAGRSGASVAATLYAPAGADIDPTTDQIEWNGDVYEIDGVPSSWTDGFTGLGAGTVVALTRAVG